MPHSVRDAVLARAARLGGAAREVLDAAAVVPGPAELWLLDALAATPAPAALDECLGSGMVVLAGGRVEFRHEIARQVVEESLLPGRRAGLHRAALAALAGQAAPDLARLAHHAEAAGDADAVLRFAPAAAERAAAAGARREAAGLYARALGFADALEPAGRATLLERFAGVAYYTGMGKQATAALREAVEIHRARGDLLRQGDALRLLAIQLGKDGALAEARAALSEAVAVLEELAPGPELARTYNAMAGNLEVVGDDQAVRWGEKAIELAERVGCLDAVGDTLNIVGTAELGRGNLEGLVKLDRSRELAEQAGDELGIVRAYMHPAAALAARREWVLAERYIQPGLVFCRERGLEAWEGWLTTLAAEAALARGRWDEAASAVATILASPAGGFGDLRVNALVISARVQARRGEPGYWPVLDEAAQVAKAAPAALAALLIAAARAEAAWLEAAPARRVGEETGPAGEPGRPRSAGSPVSLKSGVTGPGWTAVTPPGFPNRTGWRSPAMPRARPAGGKSGAVPTRRRWRWPARGPGRAAARAGHAARAGCLPGGGGRGAAAARAGRTGRAAGPAAGHRGEPGGPDQPGDGGTGAGGSRAEQRRDRRATGPLRPDRRAPCVGDLAQARRPHPQRGRRAGSTAGPDRAEVTGRRGEQ